MWQIKHAQRITAGAIAYADVCHCPTPFFQNHILVSATAHVYSLTMQCVACMSERDCMKEKQTYTERGTPPKNLFSSLNFLMNNNWINSAVLEHNLADNHHYRNISIYKLKKVCRIIILIVLICWFKSVLSDDMSHAEIIWSSLVCYGKSVFLQIFVLAEQNQILLGKSIGHLRRNLNNNWIMLTVAFFTNKFCISNQILLHFITFDFYAVTKA